MKKEEEPFYHWNIVQGSYEWLRLRLGTITATGTKCLMVKWQDVVFQSGAVTYLKRKIKESVTGALEPRKSNSAMDFGNENEPKACARFEALMGVVVKHVGFVTKGSGIACSPDGLIGDDELLEIKCPYNVDNLKKYIKDNHASKDYCLQMLHQLLVTNRKKVWFFAYDPRTDMFFCKAYTIPMLEDRLGFTGEQYMARVFLARDVIELARIGAKDVECVATTSAVKQGAKPAPVRYYNGVRPF